MYTAQISRDNPALILFLFDCSYSMSDDYTGTGMSKGQYLAKIANESIDQIILSCEKGDELRAYFEIGAVGYGDKTETLLDVRTVIDLAENPAKMEKTTLDGVEIQKPTWIDDPTREANTGMKEGFDAAAKVLASWVAGHKSSFPPVLIHVSDGQWTTGSPVAAAAQIMTDVFTDDGNTIIMNIHIGTEAGEPLVFPDAEPTGDEHKAGLFQMSSVLPDPFLKRAQENYPSTSAGARAYMFNAQPKDLSKFFDIGTRLIG